ncbi:MAG: mechanosensitive ion channel, partial [bacterium]|nr:mechanosensitive ion channel [bacterium]
MLSSFLSNFNWYDFGAKSSLIVDLFFVLILAWVGNFIAKRYLVHLFQILLSRYSQDWSKIWLRYGVISKASHFVPALIIRWFSPLFELEQFPYTKTIVSVVLSATAIYILINLALVANAFLRSIEDIYETFTISLKRPIRTYLQVLRIIIFGLVGISITALFLNMSPWTFVTGLGAATAIILLIFRDSILGLVASVQVSSYDMIRIGDWIEMAAFGADGDVIEINLNTIKVRNFDKTISTIPASALLSTGVRNWRGMVESGGR